MTTMAQLRKAATALPETEEGTHFGMVAFSVRGKGFISVTKDGWVQLHLPEADVEEYLATHAKGERLERFGTLIGLRVPLADTNGQKLNALVRASWAHRAPKRLAAAQAAAESVEPGAGDLPAAIGRPATRALHAAGIATLDDVAARSEADLLALHGIGPRAIRILNEALAQRGMTLR